MEVAIHLPEDIGVPVATEPKTSLRAMTTEHSTDFFRHESSHAADSSLSMPNCQQTANGLRRQDMTVPIVTAALAAGDAPMSGRWP